MASRSGTDEIGTEPVPRRGQPRLAAGKSRKLVGLRILSVNLLLVFSCPNISQVRHQADPQMSLNESTFAT